MSIISKLLAISNGASRMVEMSQQTLSIGSVQINGLTSGNVTVKSASTIVSPYTLTLPSAQGSAGTVLTNDGSGGLTWGAASITTGNLTESTSSILTITGGTNAVVGSGTSIQVKQASGSQSGFLSSADWTTFNTKQAALGYTPAHDGANSDITSLSGLTTALSIGQGGTGATTQQAALDNLTNPVTAGAGRYLQSDGVNSIYDFIQVLDVPTLNQNTTGTAANISDSTNTTIVTLSSLSLPVGQLTGTLPIANGGTNSATALSNAKVMVSTAGAIVESAITTTTLGYLDATSSIQTQLNAKLNLSGGTMSGAIALGSNKITDLANGTTTNDAVNYGQLSSLIGGLNYDPNGPVLVPNMISDNLTTPPGSPVNGASYLAASGASGGWTQGHVYEYNSASTTWVDVLGRAITTNDRFGINFEVLALTPAGGFTSKATNIAQVTNATPGAYAYTFTAPTSNLAVYVSGANAQDISHLYYFNSVWIDLLGGATVRPKDGAALSYNGNILNVGYDNSTIGLTANQLVIKASGITDTHISASAAIALTKLAAMTNHNRVLVSDASGLISESATTTTVLGYLDISSSLTAQLSGKVDKTSYSTTGSIVYASGVNTPATLAAGTNNYVLTMVSGLPAWATPVSHITDTLTSFVSGAGTVTNTDSIVSAINKLDGNIALKAPIASPTFTGNVVAPSLAMSTTTDSTSTGSNVTLGAFSTGLINVTNVSLSTIAGIPAGANGQVLILENNSGNTVTILNDNASATAANRIYTGTGGGVALANQASLVFSYNTTNSRWMLVAGSGGSTPGVGATATLGSGVTSATITFAVAQSGTNYVVLAQLTNLVDTNPEFQSLIITNKTTTGFTVKLNSPTDSANYSVDYKILTNSSGSGVQVGEAAVNSGVTSTVVTIPIPYATATYVAACELVNYIDTNPAYQPVLITAKTTSTFTVTWNSPTDSANYKIAYNLN